MRVSCCFHSLRHIGDSDSGNGLSTAEHSLLREKVSPWRRRATQPSVRAGGGECRCESRESNKETVRMVGANKGRKLSTGEYPLHEQWFYRGGHGATAEDATVVSTFSIPREYKSRAMSDRGSLCLEANGECGLFTGKCCVYGGGYCISFLADGLFSTESGNRLWPLLWQAILPSQLYTERSGRPRGTPLNMLSQ